MISFAARRAASWPLGAADSTSGRTHWTGWLVAAMAATVLVYALDVLFHVVPAAASDPLQKFASSWAFVGAAVLCVVKGRRAPEERSAWWLLASAMALWAAGSVYYSVALWDLTEVPYPSLADAFWLAFYVPVYAGLYQLLRKRSGSPGSDVWLDSLVAGFAVGAIAAAALFQVVLTHTDGTAVGVATNLAYPLGDLGILALVVAAVTVTGWRTASVWRWVAAAFVAFAVADGIYLILIATGEYEIGGIVDLGWPTAALLVGVAAWRHEPSFHAKPVHTGMRLVARAWFGLAAITLLVLGVFFDTNPLTISLATATILLLLVRLFLALRENEHLLAHSRIEASTDSLTGLGNRRQMRADLVQQLANLDSDGPLLLTLYDLDGFKQYNDTFGHLAGDHLLARLGARLAAALGAEGTAYRMGGDEFCALWSLGSGEETSRLAKAAAAALTEHGQGFSIGCSYGSVLLPNDAGGISDALRLADRRMYAHKNGGRTSAGQQSSAVLLRTLAERDAGLGIHIGGVAGLVCATSARLGMPDEDLEAAQLTGLLHDVGKIAIPDEILNKAGPLDEAEWVFMRRHTLIGERIIAAAPALTTVATLVRSTHERYDGSGYPDGLAGSDIPLISRVVAVCDAYDAMTTDRVYRPARSAADALVELHRCAGTQFDPDVVEAFATRPDQFVTNGSPTPAAARRVALPRTRTAAVSLEA